MADEIRLGDYLLERLVQLKLRSCLGVPGDFNMSFLDLIEDHPKLQWVGNANELNAVVTTFGVGELSALNGIAGAFSERLPVVHIVGVPSTSAQGQHALLHHTLGDGRFEAFTAMSKQISAAMVELGNLRPEEAPREIDRVLSICVKEVSLDSAAKILFLDGSLTLPLPGASLAGSSSVYLYPNRQDAHKGAFSQSFYASRSQPHL
jgi:pyruvate decarboxylase